MRKMSLRGYTLAALCTLAATAFAEETPDSTRNIVTEINASGNISVSQSEKLNKLLEYSTAPAQQESSSSSSSSSSEGEVRNKPQRSRMGYRVQVFDDNNPRTARNRAEYINRRIAGSFPHMRSYISFNSPYWRVKAGDFRSKAEADEALRAIRAAFPDLKAYLRVVRDKINTSD